MQHSIRHLTPDDAEPLYALRLLGLQESPDAFGSTAEEHLRLPVEATAQRIRENIAEGSFILGSFDEKALVGIAGCKCDTHIKMQHRAAIWGMYVHPDYRGQGIARNLLTALLYHARSIEQLEQLHLGVITSMKAARELYLSAGFTIYGVEKGGLKYRNSYFDVELMVYYL